MLEADFSVTHFLTLDYRLRAPAGDSVQIKRLVVFITVLRGHRPFSQMTLFIYGYQDMKRISTNNIEGVWDTTYQPYYSVKLKC